MPPRNFDSWSLSAPYGFFKDFGNSQILRNGRFDKPGSWKLVTDHDSQWKGGVGSDPISQSHNI
jgi:hypothetical protein